MIAHCERETNRSEQSIMLINPDYAYGSNRAFSIRSRVGPSVCPGSITPIVEARTKVESYQALLHQEGMIVSMSRTANCYENAAMESFFQSFKGECIDSQSFQTRAQARSAPFDY